ncbi:hypothetical protein ABVT39_021617 [Epinephelus coioides]
MAATRKKNRHWTREEMLSLIAVWGHQRLDQSQRKVGLPSKKVHDCLKNNKRTRSEPIKCPYFEELNAVLAGGSGSTELLSDTSRENDAEDDAASEDSGFKAPPPPTVEPKPQEESDSASMDGLCSPNTLNALIKFDPLSVVVLTTFPLNPY